MLGNFHFKMSFYGTIGTFINESGAEYLLTESGILAEGSLIAFIRRKYYNRYTQIHDLVMEWKLYESFLSTLSPKRKNAINDFFTQVPQDKGMQSHSLETSPLFQQHYRSTIDNSRKQQMVI